MHHEELLLFCLAFSTALRNKDVVSLRFIITNVIPIYGREDVVEVIQHFCNCEHATNQFGLTDEDITFLGDNIEFIFDSSLDNIDMDKVDDEFAVLKIVTQGTTLPEIVKRLESSGLKLGEHYSYLGNGNIAVNKEDVEKLVSTLR